MKKFKKGNMIIATKTHSSTGDRSYLDYPSEVLHVATHHYVLKTKYGSGAMTFDDALDRGFVKATKKMIELLVEKETT